MANDGFDVEMFVEIYAGLGAESEGAAAVGLEAEAGGVIAARRVVGDGDGAVEGTHGAAHVDAARKRFVRAGFDLGVEARPFQAFAGTGDDGDHAGIGVSAVNAGLRPANHLDPFDVFHRQVGEIEAGEAELVHLDAIDQYHEVSRIGPADENARHGAATARLRDGDAGHLSQCVGHRLDAFGAELLAEQHGRAGADARGFHRILVGGDDGFRQLADLRECRRRQQSG